MVGSPVLEKVLRPVHQRGGQEVVLKQLLIAFTVHGDILGKAVDAPPSPNWH